MSAERGFFQSGAGGYLFGLAISVTILAAANDDVGGTVVAFFIALWLAFEYWRDR